MYPQPFPQTREPAGAQGGAVVLARGTVSGASSIDVTWSGAYDRVEVLYDALVPATDRTVPLFRMSGDGGASWDAGANDYDYGMRRFSNVVIYGNGNGVSSISTTNDGGGNAANEYSIIRAWIDEPWDAARYPHLRGEMGYPHASIAWMLGRFGGRRNAAKAINGLRLFMTTGNFSGNYVAWGYRRAGR